ncbi:uncharacterized protein LOC123558850 [Mercenaria mercenaria]|uniref:uncharacterized protein LOC123558850 n=1 Tax=Mercenaria mercenaria TaxID=6596 RepID=UPI00234F3BAC|nr:uncharacterized protein LOC123558850 [Mercenaria mercenaria]
MKESGLNTGMFLTFPLLYIAASLLYVCVDCSCSFSGMPGGPTGEPPVTTCNYLGWIIEANSSFKSPAPYCEECTCYGFGSYSCCGYGWKGGYIGIPGCRRVIDNSTCDHLFVDMIDETQPCRPVSRIPA